jgi:hypothetical protein
LCVGVCDLGVCDLGVCDLGVCDLGVCDLGVGVCDLCLSAIGVCDLCLSAIGVCDLCLPRKSPRRGVNLNCRQRSSLIVATQRIGKAAQFLFCKSGDQVWGGSVGFMLR